MKLLSLTLLLVAAQMPTDAPIRLIVPSNVKVDQCQAHSFLVGSFGGAGGDIRPLKPDERAIQIPTSYESVPGTSLKALLWCPGYEMWTVSFDSLPDEQSKTLRPSLTARGAVGFAGVVQGWATPPQPLSVHVDYWAAWQCAFFRLPDCGYGPWPVADDIAIRTDGSFFVFLPDFARDRVVASFGGAGEFDFSLRDKDGNRRFELKPAGTAINQRRIAPSASYPSEQLFALEPLR